MLRTTSRGILAGLVLAAGLVAQSAVETPQNLNGLRETLQRVQQNQDRLAAENRELRKEVERMAQAHASLVEANDELQKQVNGESDEAALEAQINTARERAATVVESKANPVTLTGEFRFRTVWATVQPTGGDEFDGYWTDALARLGFQYQFARHVTAFAELQSHWAFGDGSPASGGTQFGPLVFGEASTDVDLHQAWLHIGHLFGAPEFSMKVGRQEVVLGNQFQFGNAEWYSGWSFDGYRFEWDSESFRLTGLALKLGSNDADVNQLHAALSPHDDDELYSLYFTLKTIKDHRGCPFRR